MEERYLVLAFYQYYPIENPHHEVNAHHAFFEERDVFSRIYISEQGINGQMSAAPGDAEAYMEWLHKRPYGEGIEFKIQTHHEHVFPRKTVKYRKELVALGQEVDFSHRGEYLSPEEWKKKLESEDVLLLDVRNDYEWDVGHFKGAERPPCNTFKDFPEYIKQLQEREDAKTKPIMMSCTGGIRCEVFSAMMKQAGFEKVYQLHGGVIKYGQTVGSDLWEGKLFVFDDRMTIPLDKGNSAPIGKCYFCDSTSESYYNCANMDCNELFLCCCACLEKMSGCCCEVCQDAPRRRPYSHQTHPKPFRKWYYYQETKGEAKC